MGIGRYEHHGIQVWAYTIVRNEERLIGAWCDHYGAFCARLTVFDDESDDATVRLAAEHGARVRRYPGSGLDDEAMVALANDVVQGARGRGQDGADYVIWSDADEFIYWPGGVAPRLAQLKQAGVRVPHVWGFEMHGEPFSPNGFRHSIYDKPMVIDPWLKLEWQVGRHAVKVDGKQLSWLEHAPVDLAMLHYRNLEPGWVEERNARNQARLTANERAKGLGWNEQPEFYQREHVNVLELLERAA